MLILHFDINKTLIMQDSASGSAVSTMLNSLLSEVVWGTIRPGTHKETRTVSDWSLFSNKPCTVSSNTDLVTFNDFLEEHTLVPKSIYKPLKQNFTEPGGVGESCREYYLSLLSALTIPNTSPARFHFIVPSFLNLVAELAQRKTDFGIVFRTFGHDVKEFAREWNQFVDGKHDYYPIPALPHLRLGMPLQSAAMHRSGLALSGLESCHLSHIDYDTGAIAIAHGFRDTLFTLFNKLAVHRCFFIQDDYKYWSDHSEADCAGKLLLIPSPEEKSSHSSKEQHRQLFIDDNIERKKAHIVDVRLVHAAACVPIPFSDAEGKYLLRAEPYEIITNPAYFIQQLESRGLL